MAETTAAGVTLPDTDYRYQGMVDAYLERSQAAMNAFGKVSTDAMAAVSVQMVSFGQMHAQWMGAYTQAQLPITVNAISGINASSADSTMGFIKMGMSLANSAAPPTPGYQNLGPNYPGGTGSGGGQAIMLPSGTTITTK